MARWQPRKTSSAKATRKGFSKSPKKEGDLNLTPAYLPLGGLQNDRPTKGSGVAIYKHRGVVLFVFRIYILVTLCTIYCSGTRNATNSKNGTGKPGKRGKYLEQAKQGKHGKQGKHREQGKQREQRELEPTTFARVVFVIVLLEMTPCFNPLFVLGHPELVLEALLPGKAT